MRQPQIETQLCKEFPWIGNSNFSLEVRTPGKGNTVAVGDTNRVQYTEYVYAINDVRDVLEVTITDVNDLTWLRAELTNPDFAKWTHKDTFGDRIGVSERYGFDTSHLPR